MKPPILLVLLGVLLALLGSSACQTPTTGCDCRAAKLKNQWCETCDTGWVAAYRVENRTLFEALDAHGHDLDPAVMACADCKRMMREGGFCEACRFGWVGGQAYMSRLTYHLALGEVRDPATIDCAGCRAIAGGAGWCDACSGGWAGNVYFKDRADHEAAARELVRLRAAIDASARCETCALVILVDGTCPYCKVGYRGGSRVGDGG
jgi:hypothetical protein